MRHHSWMTSLHAYVQHLHLSLLFANHVRQQLVFSVNYYFELLAFFIDSLETHPLWYVNCLISGVKIWNKVTTYRIFHIFQLSRHLNCHFWKLNFIVDLNANFYELFNLNLEAVVKFLLNITNASCMMTRLLSKQVTHLNS
jgi:hypothetical protein